MHRGSGTGFLANINQSSSSGHSAALYKPKILPWDEERALITVCMCVYLIRKDFKPCLCSGVPTELTWCGTSNHVSKPRIWRSGNDFPHLLLWSVFPHSLDKEGGKEAKCLRGFVLPVLPLKYYITCLNAWSSQGVVVLLPNLITSWCLSPLNFALAWLHKYHLIVFLWKLKASSFAKKG